MTDRQEQLIEFHLAMGVPIAPRPAVPSDERVRLRSKLIAEEFFETMASLFSSNADVTLAGGSTVSAALTAARNLTFAVIDQTAPVVDLVELADGLADLDYVVEGTRLEFGIVGDPLAKEVHETNMAKLNGPISPEGKKLKPHGWIPPRIAELLEQQKRPESLGAMGDYVANYVAYREWLAKHVNR
jgi:predicted HAD superfamily Cof-like phosphohydrolase